jgi:hypothetical protein
MFAGLEDAFLRGGEKPPGIENAGQERYTHKFNAAFSVEMSRSVREMLRYWSGA